MTSSSKDASNRSEAEMSLTFNRVMEIYTEIEIFIKRLTRLKENQARTSFKVSNIKAVMVLQVELLLYTCYYALQHEKLEENEKYRLTEIQKRARSLYQLLTSPMDPMSLTKEIARLSSYTRPYTTTNQDAASAWEDEQFALQGTTYINPADLPQMADLEQVAEEKGIHRIDSNKLSSEVAQLSLLTRSGYFSDEELEQILADPKKLERAKRLGLLPDTA